MIIPQILTPKGYGSKWTEMITQIFALFVGDHVFELQ